MNYSQSERYDRNILMPEIGFEGQKETCQFKSSCSAEQVV